LRIKRILIIRKRQTPLADKVARELNSWARERSIATVDGEAPEGEPADIAVVLGGDGTFLHGVRLLGGREIPVLGVNLGSLGFLTEIALEELCATLEDVESDRARIERRMTLSVEVLKKGEIQSSHTVLNDVVLNKGAMARISELLVSVGDKFLTTYRADGLILATPTGSTAYNLSAGGSIVAPGLAALLITPVCPHAMTQRPIILPPEVEVSVTVLRKNGEIYVTLDGQQGFELGEGDVVRVRRSPTEVLMVCSPRRDYFGVLRSKLMWGADGQGKGVK